MKTWYSAISLVTIALAVGCSSAPAPKAAEDDAPKQKSAAAAKKKDSLSRADEILADLQKREAEQSKIQQKNREAVPVIVEVTPKGGGPSAFVGSAPGSSASTSVPITIAGKDANYWRQEFSMAQVRLRSSTQRMEQAQRQMETAQAQMRDQNAAVQRMGQAAFARAQGEFSVAQGQVSSDQYAVDDARRGAIRAGVPASYLR